MAITAVYTRYDETKKQNKTQLSKTKQKQQAQANN